ncbi:MAG: InlB B-repeat-containing protein [Bacillus subtilis]|nr:InlB B-repeat-containing protein [Bacillus subtilis]
MGMDSRCSRCFVFQTDGGTEITAIEIVQGNVLERPTNPVKAGKIFAGWYFDAAFTEVSGF